MKSRKNTINGKVIVTGDVNELEPNEVLINEKLNEDGTIQLDIKERGIDGEIKSVDGNTPKVQLVTNSLIGSYFLVECNNNDSILIVGRKDENSNLNVDIPDSSGMGMYLGREYTAYNNSVTATVEDNITTISKSASGQSSLWCISCKDTKVTLDGYMKGYYDDTSTLTTKIPEHWNTPSNFFMFTDFKASEIIVNVKNKNTILAKYKIKGK